VWGIVRVRVVGVALLVWVGCAPLLANDVITGPAAVVDGDTLRVGDLRIRLHGIDAPEATQSCNAAAGGTWACGTQATYALRQLISKQDISCQPMTLDRYGRTLARCFVGELDIQAEMVRLGLAWAFIKYSSDYVTEETQAKIAKRGIWQAATQPAWDYRATRSAEYDKAAPAGCPIKGNVNRQGEKIYHLPWGRDYAKVKMDLSKGKQWFCSQDAAERAGWRLAR
jgi:endonuclease YncB( thermonuclease family)